MITQVPSIASRMGSRRFPSVRRRLAASALTLLAVALPASFKDAVAQAETLQDKIAQCVACHGETGRSENPDLPHIGGQPKLFVMYQLFFYREGRRTSPEMNTVAKGMTDSELTALSDFVAKLPPPPPTESGADATRYTRGADVAAKR